MASVWSVPLANILASMKARSAGSVRNCLSELRFEKLVFGDGRAGCRLTRAGYAAAVEAIRRLAA